MKVLSINTAQAQVMRVGKKDVTTGIYKMPQTGPVVVTELGLEGDTIVNKKFHGGEDQALYIYSGEDYAWWKQQLKMDIPPGMFGENLTITDFHSGELKIGDRLRIDNDVELEITAPRVPCSQFATKMNDSGFAKKFVAAKRPGAYARVISGGIISEGSQIRWFPTNADYATIEEVFVEWHKKAWSEEVAIKTLGSPVSKIARRLIEERTGYSSN